MLSPRYAEQPILYHGDEIEVDCDVASWTSKKTLRILKYGGIAEWIALLFLVELKVQTATIQSFAGIFIDEAGVPTIEIPVMGAEYQLFERSLKIADWTLGTHLIELKLKSDSDKIYNRLFEIYVVPPLPPGAMVSTS